MALWELNQIWIDCAKRIDLPVERGGDAYVHFDGKTLHIATDDHLDADDSLAQLILHEICHSLVEGPDARHRPDWTLDNTHDEDFVREQAAVRLQAHLAGAYGLRGTLYPTTSVRTFFESLPRFALGNPADHQLDQSIALAYVAADRAGKRPFAGALGVALDGTARCLGFARHPKSGHALVADQRRCGGCVWRAASGLCRQAAGRRFVTADDRACVRHEAEASIDCLTCGACCRSAFDTVLISSREVVRHLHPDLVLVKNGQAELRRNGDRCAALSSTGDYRCRIYSDRPRTCHDFERAGRHCLTARRRVGLSA